MSDRVTGDVNRETETAIYFYTPRYYVFDNFSAYTVAIWEKTFSTAEHAYQWKKYAEILPEVAEEILHAESPYAAKKTADAHKHKVPEDWGSKKAGVMREILATKLRQHEKVRRMLLETGEKEIVENSPDDPYWGVGADGNGQNMLGKLWMELRTELRANN